jgi:hypothetical protein
MYGCYHIGDRRKKDMGINGYDADLFDAAEFGDLDWVQRSIGSMGVDGKPIDINVQDLRGETILMIASRYAWSEIVRFLLDHGADPNLRNNKGQTALMLAQDREANLREYEEVVTLLKESGAAS